MPTASHCGPGSVTVATEKLSKMRNSSLLVPAYYIVVSLANMSTLK